MNTSVISKFSIVRTVWPKMFQARISNCINLFRLEPNRTHRLVEFEESVGLGPHVLIH